MYPFIEEIVQMITEQVLRGNVKFALYSGHDTVIAPLLAALGISVIIIHTNNRTTQTNVGLYHSLWPFSGLQSQIVITLIFLFF